MKITKESLQSLSAMGPSFAARVEEIQKRQTADDKLRNDFRTSRKQTAKMFRRLTKAANIVLGVETPKKTKPAATPPAPETKPAEKK